MTVLKAGFLGSGRFGSGIIVARLPDGTWSAPSAITSAGAGFGGQIGFELTDFVFILNDYASVRTFAQAGTLTLGTNVSIAAGPVGRNAEAAGAASLKGVGGVFAYSKTKGLFAGVSLEGGGLVERRDANEKMYHQRYRAEELLQGAVPQPAAAEALYRVLNSRVFSGAAIGGAPDSVYNDIPIYDSAHENEGWGARRNSAFGEGMRSNRTGGGGFGDDYEYRDKPQKATTWADDVFDRDTANAGSGVRRTNTVSRANPSETFDRMERRNTVGPANNYVFRDKPKPSRPTAPKPKFGVAKTGSLGPNQAIAKFTFDPDQAGDLGFKKGEVITILKKTEKETDWWTGRIGDREGIFPRQVACHCVSRLMTNNMHSNYVETV